MRTIRKALSGAVIGVGLTLGLMAGSAEAQLLPCPLVIDGVRTGLFTIQAADRGIYWFAELQKVSIKKKELKIWEKRKQFKSDEAEEGEEGEEGAEGGGGDLFPSGVFYSYMKDANATGSEKYLPAKSKPKDQEKYIRENFFYDSDLSKVTEEMKEEVQQRRQAYLENLASEILSLSAGARDSIASELSILKSAKTTAGGLIQQVDLLVQNKKVMVEQKAADILLQAKLLELDAARLLLGLSPQRIEKPEGSTTDSSSGFGSAAGSGSGSSGTKLPGFSLDDIYGAEEDDDDE